VEAIYVFSDVFIILGCDLTLVADMANNDFVEINVRVAVDVAQCPDEVLDHEAVEFVRN
jgi:hypothetical protein